jgi:hypothetical protein
MKYLISLIFIAFAFESYAQNAQNSFNGDGTVKTRRIVYSFVKNSQGSTFDQGDVVCHDNTDDDGISVAYCAALGDPGYCMIDEACEDGKMCKCIVEGYTAALDFDGNGDNAVAGKPIFTGTDGNANAATTPTAGHKVIGTFLDAASASGAVEAYVKF